MVVGTEVDRQETQRIERILREDYNQYETPPEEMKKRRILGKLQTIVVDWIKTCGKNDGRDEETIENSGGKIFTFGSYRKGVNGPGSDIDTLVVAPRHIDRDNHFFDILAPMLEAEDEVTELT